VPQPEWLALPAETRPAACLPFILSLFPSAEQPGRRQRQERCFPALDGAFRQAACGLSPSPAPAQRPGRNRSAIDHLKLTKWAVQARQGHPAARALAGRRLPAEAGKAATGEMS